MLILPVENLVSRLILNHSSLNEEITNSATLDVFLIFFFFFWGGGRFLNWKRPTAASGLDGSRKEKWEMLCRGNY